MEAMNILLKEATLVVSMLMQQQASLPEEEVVCMARSIYHEARGESTAGQIAVGYVKKNRAESPAFPDTICDVIAEDRGPLPHDCQFSWYCDGKSDTPQDWRAYQNAVLVAIKILDARVENPVPAATHYYAPAKADPYWAYKITEVAVVGNHRFMEE